MSARNCGAITGNRLDYYVYVLHCNEFVYDDDRRVNKLEGPPGSVHIIRVRLSSICIEPGYVGGRLR